MTKYSMFLQIVRKSILNRKSRMLVAFSAIVIGATVAAAMLSLTYDINSKMNRELRVYGANLSITPSSSSTRISSADVKQAKRLIPKNAILGFMPYLFAVGKADESEFAIAGAAFNQAPIVTPYWEIDKRKVSEIHLSTDPNSAYIGSTLANQLHLKSRDTYSFQLVSDPDKQFHRVKISGILSTGGTEDNQMYLPLSTLQEWTHYTNQVSVVEASLLGNRKSIDTLAQKINTSIPSLSASPILKIAKAEGSILQKIHGFMILISLTILIISAITVMTTMTALTFERQNEIALIKAIGAEDKDVLLLFLGELLILGLVGGAIGYIAGFGLSQILGKALFHTFINLRFIVIPITLIISCLITIIAGLWTVRRILQIEPAIVLRGE